MIISFKSLTIMNRDDHMSLCGLLIFLIFFKCPHVNLATCHVLESIFIFNLVSIFVIFFNLVLFFY